VSQTTGAALPDPQAAYNHLFQAVHSQVFFQKCAAAGIHPRTADEANWMLECAGKLRQISEDATVKQAAAQDNPYYRMSAGLDAVMAQYGLAGGPTKTAADAEAGYKQAAASLMADPSIYNSVLALKAHEAAQLKTEFDAWSAANGTRA
jgi:hypothetical protein